MRNVNQAKHTSLLSSYNQLTSELHMPLCQRTTPIYSFGDTHNPFPSILAGPSYIIRSKARVLTYIATQN